MKTKGSSLSSSMNANRTKFEAEPVEKRIRFLRRKQQEKDADELIEDFQKYNLSLKEDVWEDNKDAPTF
jgi:hypothetical protein